MPFSHGLQKHQDIENWLGSAATATPSTSFDLEAVNMLTPTPTTSREATLQPACYTRNSLSIVAMQTETSDSDGDDSLDDLPAHPMPYNHASRRARRGASTTSTRQAVFDALGSSGPTSLLYVNPRSMPLTPPRPINQALAFSVDQPRSIDEDTRMDTVSATGSSHDIAIDT